jgi:branched-chain amino acid transport system ATP-binding protein
MADPMLRVTRLTKHFGGFVALDGVDLELAEGERLGLIGPNGSGKTTAINCITGALRNDAGSIQFRGEDICRLPAHERTHRGIVRTFQIPRPFRSMTILENLQLAMEYSSTKRKRSQEMADEAQQILELVGFGGRANESSGRLTQVDLRKLELARALAALPQLLISDEAMAGLSSSEIDEILDILFKLNQRGVAVIMIEHIMRAVLRYSQRVIVLNAGHKIAEGKPEDVVKDPQVERAYLGV